MQFHFRLLHPSVEISHWGGRVKSGAGNPPTYCPKETLKGTFFWPRPKKITADKQTNSYILKEYSRKIEAVNSGQYVGLGDFLQHIRTAQKVPPDQTLWRQEVL